MYLLNGEADCRNNASTCFLKPLELMFSTDPGKRPKQHHKEYEQDDEPFKRAIMVIVKRIFHCGHDLREIILQWTDYWYTVSIEKNIVIFINTICYFIANKVIIIIINRRITPSSVFSNSKHS